MKCLGMDVSGMGSVAWYVTNALLEELSEDTIGALEKLFTSSSSLGKREGKQMISSRRIFGEGKNYALWTSKR